MKLKDIKNEIKVLDIAALMAKTEALRIEINDLVLDKNTNKLKDLKSIDKKKKYLARVFTALNQKQMIEGLEVKPVTEDKKPEVEEVKKVKKGANK